MTREQATELVEALLYRKVYYNMMWAEIDYDAHPELIEERDESWNELIFLKEEVIKGLMLSGGTHESR